MFLVLDQGIPLGAASLLRTSGIECIHVGEMAMAHAEDSTILNWSLDNQGTVVTLDADFHAILAVTRAHKPSVVRIRIQGLNATAITTIVLDVIVRFHAQLETGALLTVKNRKTTCHILPIGIGTMNVGD